MPKIWVHSDGRPGEANDVVCTGIEHPDVRRMLMHMKAYVDGMRSFIYYVGLCFDHMATAADDKTRAAANGLIDVLTPVVKAYCSDRAFEVCTLAVQTFGGYGYTGDYPVEQYLRDCKITSIYEGTNGIQAMDLLGRKLGSRGANSSWRCSARCKRRWPPPARWPCPWARRP